MASMINKYEVIIGIECHVQLATKSKLFCACDNDSREAEPNTHVCPVCLGMPGALPVLNRHAVELAIRLGLALGATYPEKMHTKFDRKNYFYPDLPKGYQITQFDEPIVPGGAVEIMIDGSPKTIGVTRAHLEGDAGKLTHPEGANYSLVDLNRAETPLVEIVSEPDMRSAAEAKAYAQELYNIVRYAEVSEANLYYGNMRFDVNVSLHLPGMPFGTRTETKNLNSFRAIEQVVNYEIKRQGLLLDEGDKIRQETRGWNDAKGETYAMRSKEDADEYRYFPEPDLPPLVITTKQVDVQRAELGDLPQDLRAALVDAKLDGRDGEALVAEPTLAKLWKQVTIENPEQARFALTWLMGDQMRLAELKHQSVRESDISSLTIAAVGAMVTAGELSSTNAKALLAELWDKDTGAHETAERIGLIQQSDSEALAKVVEGVLAANPQAVADLISGNMRALGALVGAGMKATKGQGNPQMLTKIIKDQLKLS